jgi:hypothetical protein
VLASPGNLQWTILKMLILLRQNSLSIWNLRRCTPVHDLHTTFNLLYVYDYKTKFCRQQEVIENHEKENILNMGQGEARHKKCKWLELEGSKIYNRLRDYAIVVA